MTYGNLFAQPRQTTASTTIIVDTTTAVSTSVFRVTGGPVAVWSFHGDIQVAFPNANVQFKLVFAPTATPSPVADLCTQTQTFFTQWKVGGKFFLDSEIAQPMQSSDIVSVRTNPSFVRFLSPGTVFHVNDNSAGGTPAQMLYNILWSPMAANSNVQGL